MIDEINRAFAGEKPSGYVPHVHLFMADNIEKDGGKENKFDPGNGYRDEYKKIWARSKGKSKRKSPKWTAARFTAASPAEAVEGGFPCNLLPEATMSSDLPKPDYATSNLKLVGHSDQGGRCDGVQSWSTRASPMSAISSPKV